MSDKTSSTEKAIEKKEKSENEQEQEMENSHQDKPSSLDDLLVKNKQWANFKVKANPDFFKRLSNIQSPKFLWIGCSDSRVPPDKITQTQPGEIFIHRNVANLVVYTDMNLLSVVQYAVYILKVQHIIVCGHYNCGGVHAAFSKESLGLIDNWLRNIKDVYRFNKDEVDSIKDEHEKVNRMVELNVIEQVYNLSKTNLIQNAWKEGNNVDIHGWVYDLSDGIIRPVIVLDANTKRNDGIYKYDKPKF